MKKCLFLALAAALSFSACKKSDSGSNNNSNNNNNGNSNKLCSGNTADASYFPLKTGNTWTYASQNTLTGTVTATELHHGNTYYRVNYTDGKSTNYTLVLRNDNTNQTLYYNAATDSDYSFVPAKPDTVYNWRFPLTNGKFGRRRVTGVNVPVNTASCSYKATEITQYDDKGNTTKYYYVKGLGEVRETGLAPLDLSAVVLE